MEGGGAGELERLAGDTDHLAQGECRIDTLLQGRWGRG